MATFDDQVDTYVSLGIPRLAGLTEGEFLRRVQPLADLASQLTAPAVASPGHLPFVLVIPGVPASQLMTLTVNGGRNGYVDMTPVTPDVFQPLPELGIPDSPYLAVDVDTGADTLNVPPAAAGPRLVERGRSPLTIDEGIAAELLHPGLLRRANCYQMLASRDSSKRIPSLWVTKDGRPRLGWCFAGVPHSWLGAASCQRRLTASTSPAQPS